MPTVLPRFGTSSLRLRHSSSSASLEERRFSILFTSSFVSFPSPSASINLKSASVAAALAGFSARGGCGRRICRGGQLVVGREFLERHPAVAIGVEPIEARPILWCGLVDAILNQLCQASIRKNILNFEPVEDSIAVAVEVLECLLKLLAPRLRDWLTAVQDRQVNAYRAMWCEDDDFLRVLDGIYSRPGLANGDRGTRIGIH